MRAESIDTNVICEREYKYERTSALKVALMLIANLLQVQSCFD